MASTAKEMIVVVGMTVQLAVEALWFDVKVIDVKNSWGRTRLLVIPVAGAGERWVELTSVRLRPVVLVDAALVGGTR